MRLHTGPLVALAIIALGLLVASLLLAAPAHAADVYIPEDWVIDSDLVYDGDDIIVKGNINIRDGGSLTIRNCTFKVDSQRGDQFRLTVEETGNLYAYDSTISNRYANNNDERFFFDVRNDTVFVSCTISRLYGWDNDHPGGLRLLGGTHHLIKDCLITDSRTYGVYARCPVTLKGTTIRSTNWNRFTISTSGQLDDMEWRVDNCTFVGDVDDPYSIGISCADGYAGQYERYLNVTHCTFEGMSYGVYVDPEWRNGRVDITFNNFDRNTYGVRAWTNSLEIVMHHNHYTVRSGGYGIRLYQGSYGNCTWHNEDIRGASLGYGYGAYLEGAGTGVHKVRKVSIWNTYYGIIQTFGPSTVVDSYINTTNNNFYVYNGATMDIYNTEHRVGSGFVDTSGGRITAWQRLNISSVKWSDGTLITQGTMYLLNDTSARIGMVNLSAGPTSIDFKRWEAMRAYLWTNVDVYPALLDVDTWFRASKLDYLESRPQTIVFTDDFTPVLQVTSPEDGAMVNVSYLIVEGKVRERGRGLSSVQVSLDGTTWATVTVTGEMWDFAYSKISDGRYNLRVRAEDKAGNVADVTVAGIIVDTAPPTIDLDETPPTITNQPLLVLQGTTEPGATIYMDRSLAWPDASGRFTLEFPLEEGVNGLVLKVQDVAGNWNQMVLSILLDIDPPQLEITSPDQGRVTNQPVVTVTGATEEGATVTIDGTEVATYKGVFSQDLELEEGQYVLVVEAVDEAGNSAVQRRTVTVDTTPPSLVIDSPSGGTTTTTDDSAFITGRMDADIDRIFINGKGEDALPGEFALQVDLSEGDNTFNVVVRDAAGNEARTTVTIVRDTRAPKYTVEDVQVTDGEITRSDGTLYASGEDLVFYVSVDETAVFSIGSQTHEGQGQFSFGHTLKPGVNTVRIDVADAMGNLATPYVYTITYDITPPSVAITYPDEGFSTDQSELVLRGVTDDPDSKVWIDDIPVGIKADGTFEKVVNLALGENTYRVRNRDRAGNEDETTITVERKESEPVSETSLGGMVLALVVGLVVGVAIMYVVGRRRAGPGELPDEEPGEGPPMPPGRRPPPGPPGGPGWEEY